jgi:hypothetical protein
LELVSIPASEAKIFRNDDGTISSKSKALKDMNGQAKRFSEIGPMMFRDINDQDRVAFKRDASGNLVGIIDFPFIVFQKASAWHNSAFQLPLIISSLVVLILAVLLSPHCGPHSMALREAADVNSSTKAAPFIGAAGICGVHPVLRRLCGIFLDGA